MSSSQRSRRKRSGRRATKQPYDRKMRDRQQFNPPPTPVLSGAARKAGRSGADRRVAEQRGVEPAGERDERLAVERDVERATVPHARKAPTLCGD